jgi:hypothetical protein
MATVYVAKQDFLPESARRTFHVDVKAGDRLVFLWRNENGDMTKRGNEEIFLSEEDIYRYCDTVDE